MKENLYKIKENLYKMIMNVDFKSAEKIFLTLSNQEQREVIEELVYDTYSMIIYAFVQYINEKNEKILFHEIQFDMLSNALCHIEGAYQMALYHNQRLLELVPNDIQYMEWMLLFYDVKVIGKEKTISFAKKILEIDINNVNAQDFLKRLT